MPRDVWLCRANRHPGRPMHYGNLSYSRRKASSKIFSDPGPSAFTSQLSQVPIRIVTRQWMYPLSLHCRNAISSMRFVTRPFLQISQTTGSSSAAIAHPLAVALTQSVCVTIFGGSVSYFKACAETEFQLSYAFFRSSAAGRRLRIHIDVSRVCHEPESEYRKRVSNANRG